MYIPPVFKTDSETAWALVTARRFGTLIAVDDGLPVAAHVPFFVDRPTDAASRSARIELHLARANPLAGIIARAPKVLVTVQGPDAYVSPDWYVSTDQVPTWNYVSVHLTGLGRLIPASETLAHVDRLSARFEADLAPKPPWASAKMTPAKRESMLAAIVVVEIEVGTIEAQVKLAQHKSRPDRMEVARMLDWRGRHEDRALAALMHTSLRA